MAETTPDPSTIVRKSCAGCRRDDRPHALRTGANGKLYPRSLCTECWAEKAKAWRDSNWQRAKARDIWKGMINRCHNPAAMRRWWAAANVPNPSNYADKGIKVCDRWRHPTKGFENFLADLGLPPDKTSTLDRINPRRNYTPANCRWTDPRTQQENRRHVLMITATNPMTGIEETRCQADWARTLGVTASRMRRSHAGGLDWPQVIQAMHVPF